LLEYAIREYLPKPLASANCVDSFHQQRDLHWLWQIRDGTCGKAAFSSSMVTMRGNEDCRYREALTPQVMMQLKSAHARHLQIHDKTMWMLVRDSF
jgi:hypothetical protein